MLLVAILAAFAVEGIAIPAKWEQILTTVLLGATLLLALFAAEANPRVMRPALAVVGCVLAFSVVEAVNGNVDGGSTRIANALLVLLAPPAIVHGVVSGLRTKQAVTLEAVFGVLCVYILVGMFFASVYGAIDRYGHGPFFVSGETATVSHCLYFSFTSLTTVGFGDFTARSNLGHTLAVSEALIGQIYLVTVVSLLVANLGRHRQPQDAAPLRGDRE
ncbi:MAG TPA: potassium channel family protein [Solirubrobacteraceae bacterium]|nr:potassium channel family protein [Solirubrobacteraceae bacterium]